jgi:3-hydroxyisobutyrate dehydrogenase-like beta-hydroxyacid dehydrogenase
LTVADVSILGGGSMARAYAAALEGHGVVVAADGEELAGVILLAFFSGKQTLAFLERAAIGNGSLLIDLATQSLAEARACQDATRRAGLRYLAGGATGGAGQVGTTSFTVLLGAVAPDESLPAWLPALGAIRTFDSVEKSVGAKLLHNLVLVLVNFALGAALDLAERSQIPDMLGILAEGTAGRPLRAASAARDRSAPPASSYTGDLAAKDLRAIAASFPALAALEGLDLERLAGCYQELGQQPFTVVANRLFQG